MDVEPREITILDRLIENLIGLRQQSWNTRTKLVYIVDRFNSKILGNSSTDPSTIDDKKDSANQTNCMDRVISDLNANLHDIDCLLETIDEMI